MLDELDRQILGAIQSNFPLVSEPFKHLAEQLNTSEEEIIRRLKRLQEKGVIRRLGGIFDSRRLGYTGTLCALKVPEDDIERVAAVINSYPGVTHNYLREHQWNMWFTLLVESPSALEKILKEIKERTGIEQIYSFPAERIFKIRVHFPL